MDPWPESRHSIRCKIDECHHSWTCDRPGCSCALVTASHFPYICHRPDPTYTSRHSRMSWPENCCPAQSMPAISIGLVPYVRPANISVSFSVCRDWLACDKQTKGGKNRCYGRMTLSSMTFSIHLPQTDLSVIASSGQCFQISGQKHAGHTVCWFVRTPQHNRYHQICARHFARSYVQNNQQIKISTNSLVFPTENPIKSVWCTPLNRNNSRDAFYSIN